MFAYVSADVPSRVHSLDKTKKKETCMQTYPKICEMQTQNHLKMNPYNLHFDAIFYDGSYGFSGFLHADHGNVPCCANDVV